MLKDYEKNTTYTQKVIRSNGMWVIQSDTVTGTCNESDTTFV